MSKTGRKPRDTSPAEAHAQEIGMEGYSFLDRVEREALALAETASIGKMVLREMNRRRRAA